MTDTVDDVVVVGQRRRNGSDDPFPSLPSSEPQWPGQDAEIDPGDTGQLNPCDNPATRYEWDMDAAMAKAKAAMVQKRQQNGESDFNTREYGAWLYRDAQGRIQAGPVAQGNPFANGGVGSVPIPLGNIDPASIVGSVHSHSVGNHLPSPTGPDGSGDITHLNWIRDQGIGQRARLYIVAQNLVGAGETQYDQVNVYTPGTAQDAINNQNIGPEVNPNGQSCPL